MSKNISKTKDNFTKIIKKEEKFDHYIDTLVNNTKKNHHLKLRVKETKPIYQRPKAPHNTTQYLSQIYKENRNSNKDLNKYFSENENELTSENNLNFTQFTENQLDNENNYSLGNFIVIGGSLKGIIKLF